MLFLIMVERLERLGCLAAWPLVHCCPLHVLLLQDARNQVLVQCNFSFRVLFAHEFKLAVAKQRVLDVRLSFFTFTIQIYCNTRLIQLWSLFACQPIMAKPKRPFITLFTYKARAEIQNDLTSSKQGMAASWGKKKV